MVNKGKRVALYVRVSTDGQTVVNQRRELEAVAERHGWDVVKVYSDQGVRGSKGRDQRLAFDALCKGIARRDFDLVAAWSVDRLGRSLQHLIEFLGEMKAKGVDLYLHQQGLDTSTPAGRAMYQMLGVFAEFERAMIVGRINAGLARARAQGKTLGRPKVDASVEKAVRALRAKGNAIRKVAAELGIGVSTVQRIDAGGWSDYRMKFEEIARIAIVIKQGPCPYGIGDCVIYTPTQRGIDLSVMFSSGGQLVPGNKYTVKEIQKDSYVLVDGYDHPSGGIFWTEFEKCWGGAKGNGIRKVAAELGDWRQHSAADRYRRLTECLW